MCEKLFEEVLCEWLDDGEVDRLRESNGYPRRKVAQTPGAYLQDRQRAAVLGQPPRVRPRNIPHPRIRDLLQVEPNDVVLDVLQHLCAADVRLAEVAQEVPQAELERDLVRVRVPAEVLHDEGVVRVKGLFVPTAVQDDANDLALLHLGQFELRKARAGVDVVLQKKTNISRGCKLDSEKLTSLLISTMKILLRMSVFMP